MKTFSQLVKQIGLDESSGTIWDKIMGHALTGKGILKFSYPGDSAKISVTIKTASELLGAYLSLSTSRQQQFTEMINRNAVSFWSMSEWAKEMGVTHISVGESTELEEAKNLDALWQKFLKKIKMRPFDRKERARNKEETKKIRKYQKMVGITSSVEHLDERMYAPMYFDAGMNNDANKDKFIKTMRKHRLTVVTRGKTGTVEVFPKQGSDQQTIYKYAKLYGMITVHSPDSVKRESVELDEATTWLKWDNKSQDGQSYGREMTLKILKAAGYPNVDKLKKKDWKQLSNKEKQDIQKVLKTKVAGSYKLTESVELDEKVKGWIAIYNGKELEIPNDGKVKGIYGAKQLAIKHFDIPMSKWGKLAISIAESVELGEFTVPGYDQDRALKSNMPKWRKNADAKTRKQSSPKIKYAKIIKGIRDSQGPFSVVAIKGKKVVAQKNSIKNSKMLPIEVNDMADAHPGATISIESKGGKILNTFKESVEHLDEVRKGYTDEIVANAILKRKKLKRNATDKDIIRAINDELEKMGLSSTAIAWHMRNQDFLGDAFSAIRSGLKESVELDEKVISFDDKIVSDIMKFIDKVEGKKNKWSLVGDTWQADRGTNWDFIISNNKIKYAYVGTLSTTSQIKLLNKTGGAMPKKYGDIDKFKNLVKKFTALPTKERNESVEHLDEKKKPQYKEGDFVQWQGKKGTIVRYDDKGPASPFYVVSFKGKYMSLRIPQHKLEESVQLDEKVKLTSLKSAVKYIEQAYRSEVTPNWKTKWSIKRNSAESQDWSIEKVGKLFNWEYHGEGLSNILSFMSADGREDEGHMFAYAVDEIVAWLADARRWDESVEHLDEGWEKDLDKLVAKNKMLVVRGLKNGKNMHEGPALKSMDKTIQTMFVKFKCDTVEILNNKGKVVLTILKKDYMKKESVELDEGKAWDDIVDIQQKHTAKKIHGILVDAQTARLLVQIHNSLDKSKNKKSFIDTINKGRNGLKTMVDFAWKQVKKESTINEAETLHWDELDKDEREDFLKHAKLHKKLMTKDWRELDSRTQKSLKDMITKTTEGEFALEESKSKDAILDVLDAIEELGKRATAKNIAKETKLNIKFVEDALEFWIDDKKISKKGSVYTMEEEIANTSSGGGVSGMTPDTVGGDSRIMKMHRRKKKKKNIDELEESIEKDIKNADLILRDNFCGHPVFQVTEDEFNKCKSRRAKNERWSNYFDEDSSSGLKIKSYSHKNPSKPIIVQNEITGEMVFYRRRLNDNRLKHNVKSKRLSEQE